MAMLDDAFVHYLSPNFGVSDDHIDRRLPDQNA